MAPPSRPIDRRHHLRRAIAMGVVLGTLAGLVVGLLEAARALAAAPLEFDRTGERVRFVLFAAGVAAAGGTLAGALEGVAVALAGQLTRGVVRPQGRQLWQARIYTLLLAPAAIALPLALLSG